MREVARLTRDNRTHVGAVWHDAPVTTDEATNTEPTPGDGDNGSNGPASGGGFDVGKAYERLGIAQALKPSDLLKSLNIPSLTSIGSSAMRLGIPEERRLTAPELATMPPMIDYDIPVFEPDDSPQRTADATEQMVEVLRDVHTVTADLVRLTNTNLQLTQAQQESARRTERFTRGMTWASLAVAVASLGAAVVAIFTSGPS